MNMTQGMFEVSPETFQSQKLFDNQRQFRSHQICTNMKVKSYLNLVLKTLEGFIFHILLELKVEEI